MQGTEELVWSSDSEVEAKEPPPVEEEPPMVIQTKPKKPRSKAQMEAFAKAARSGWKTSGRRRQRPHQHQHQHPPPHPRRSNGPNLAGVAVAMVAGVPVPA